MLSTLQIQILGKGNCYDDTCQLSFMSEATVFTFLTFCERCAEELYEEHVHLPEGAGHRTSWITTTRLASPALSAPLT